MKRFASVLAVALLLCLAACTRDPKELARKYVETGNRYYEKGNFKSASIMYRRALQKDMRNAQAHYKLGLIEMKQNMAGEARRSFLRATDIDHNNLDALAKLAELNLSIYVYDRVTYKSYLGDAKDVVKNLLNKDPKSFDGLRLAGYIAYYEKDFPASIQKLNAANAVKPDQPEVLLSLVRALAANNQTEEAEKLNKDLIAKHKDFGQAYDTLYTHYAATNRTPEAESILKQKAENNPTVANDWIQLAFHYYLAKHPDEMNAALARLTSDPKTFPQGHLIVGDYLMRIHDVDRALQEYQAGEKVDVKNKAAYGKRQAEALSIEGKSSDAANVINRLLKDNPKDVETVAMHASSIIQSKDPKQVQRAIDELQPLLASTPSDKTSTLQMLHFNLARAYMAKGDRVSQDKAKEQLEATIKLNPNHGPAKLALAELLMNRGESAKALQAANEVLQLQPNNLNAHLVRTVGLMNIGENQHARDELTAILKAMPASTDARFQLAMLDTNEKRYKEAEANFEILIKANDPRGTIGMVKCKTLEGDLNGALQLARNQLQKQPDSDDYRRVLVETEIGAGRYEDAINDYQPVVQKAPTGVNYVHLGELQRNARQYDAAIASFKKAQQLLPNEAMPVVGLALVYDFAGRPEQARQEYEHVLKLQPDNAAALNNLAYSMADQGVDLDKALAYAERARAKMPNDLDVSDTLGLIYLRKNQVPESTRLLGELVSKAPNRATYHLHYATALYQRGDKSGARKELDAAARTGPSEKEKLQIQELRQKLS